MRSFIVTIAVIALLVLPCGKADATTYYFTGAAANDLWTNQDNWSTTSCSSGVANALPTANDDVVVCEDVTAEVTNTNSISSAYARTVTVQSGGHINIQPTSSFAATLTLGSGSSLLTSTLSTAGIVLKDAVGSSNKATLAFVSADHTLVTEGGTTNVSGEDNLAEITIADDTTLTADRILIQGALKIIGDGKFVSEGSVVESINEGQLLLVQPYELDDLVAADDREPIWRIYGAGTLQFGSGISVVTGGSLVGDFFIGGDPLGTIIVDEPLTTAGMLDLSSGGTLVVNQSLTIGSSGNASSIGAGTIEVAANKTFTCH